MDFKQLRTFTTAAKLLNFSSAASQLGYVQSAVTMQIKALEDELKQPLFERTGRGVRLTEAGDKLLKYSVQILQLRDEAIEQVSDIDEMSGLVKLTGHDTVLSYRLPRLLDSFIKEYPNIKLSIVPASFDEFKPLLLTREVDIAFVLGDDFIDSNLVSEPILKEEIVVVANPEHPLVNKQNVYAEDLINETLLLTDSSCSYRKKFENVLAEKRIICQDKLEFSSIEVIKSCIKLGMGISAISKVSVEKELETNELAILNWKESDLCVNLNMVWSVKHRETKRVRTFVEQVKLLMQD